MPLEKIRVLSLLIISASIAAYLSGDLDPAFFMLLLGSTLPLWYGLDLEKLRQHPMWKLYGSLTFGLVVLLYYLNIPMKTAIFSLVLFCIIFELYGETRQRAPVRLLSLLSFLVVLYYARIESGLMLFLGVLIYIFTLIFVMLVFHRDQLHRYRPRYVLRLLLPASNHFLIIFCAGLACFWVLPRSPHQSLGSIPSLGGDRISGFTSRVTLNDIGSLKLSRKHILDLKPMNGELHSTYLKGKVLDHYRDGVWSSLVYQSNFPRPDESHHYKFGTSQDKTYEYSVDLEALHGNTVFFMDNLVELKGSLKPLKVQGSFEQITVLRDLPLALSYSFRSAPGPIPSRLPDKAFYLQIPPRHAYFQTMGNDILRGREDLSVRAHVNIFLRYFSSFKYTLDINNRQAHDPLKYFLTTTREGHCELFASAMVMLLRAQGIPARLVTGFYIPVIHPSGDFYYVTESDAHAWVEYYDEGFWHTVDPTPPTTFTSASFLETRVAYIRRFWRQILSWNYDAQLDSLMALRERFQLLRAWLAGVHWGHWALLSLVFPLWVAFRFLPLFIRPGRRLTHFYRRFLTKLERRFGGRKPRETVYDYGARLGLPQPTDRALRIFLDRYHATRFGRLPADNRTVAALILEGKGLLEALDAHEG